jgi:hypothetical protein
LELKGRGGGLVEVKGALAGWLLLKLGGGGAGRPRQRRFGIAVGWGFENAGGLVLMGRGGFVVEVKAEVALLKSKGRWLSWQRRALFIVAQV